MIANLNALDLIDRKVISQWGTIKMYIAYLDETGDDGYPQYSSKIFVLTALYLHHQHWKETYSRISDFRRQLKADFDLPVKMEMHTKHFVLNKNPYRCLDIPEADRVQIIGLFMRMIAGLDVRIVNVAIIKENIVTDQYPVLDKALTYCVQRIENDLGRLDPEKRFMIISDPGRISKMRRTTRRIQRINFIPSKRHPGVYRQDIKALIEDPLQKDSKESHFIQLSDMVSYLVYNHILSASGETFGKRMPAEITSEKIVEWLEVLKPALNIEASKNDEFGLVKYPKH